jgi:hypothetical protein
MDQPRDLGRLRTVPLAERRHLVHEGALGKPGAHAGLNAFLESMPDLLAAKSLKDLVARMRAARNAKRGLVWGLGAHVLKVGVGPWLIELMKSGWITHLSLNGAGVIHDFELAYCGQTSEDVAQALRDGSFGMARETGEQLGALISGPEARAEGAGAHVGRAIAASSFPHRHLSVLGAAHRLGVPVSVHVALGGDVLHHHPAFDWGGAAQAARRDFERMLDAVESLNGGGVYLNVGSAVLLPEVFLKAVSIVRNLGRPLGEFTTVVLDMLDHYRPRENVLARPGGTGIKILGHHEIMLPLLSGLLLEKA